MYKDIVSLTRKGIGSLKSVSLRQFGGMMLGITGALMIALAAFTGTARASSQQCVNATNPPLGLNAICMWYHADFVAPGFIHSYPGVYVCYGMPAGFNDQVTALYNRTNYHLQYFEHGGCVSLLGIAEPYETIANVGAADNDKISSYRLH